MGAGAGIGYQAAMSASAPVPSLRLILGLVLGLVATPVLPAPSGAQAVVESPNPAALLQQPGPFVADVLSRLFALLQDRSLSPVELQRRILALALGTFDIEGITRFVAGPGWRTASAEERQAFRALLQDYVMQLYGSKIRGIDKAPSFAISAVRQEDDVAAVTAEFPIPGAPPLHVDFRVVRTAEGPRIADLSVVGISLVRTGRDEFTAVLGQNGNSLTALMTLMRRKLAERPPA